MRYYSDVTKKFYETEDACIEAEKNFNTSEEEMKKEVNALREAMNEAAQIRDDAQAAYEEARKKYIAKNAEYKAKFPNPNKDTETLENLFLKWLL